MPPPSKARSAPGAGGAFTEAKVRLDVEGASKAISTIGQFGQAIEQLSKTHQSSVAKSKEFAWASHELGKTHGTLRVEVTRINHLFGLYKQELKDVSNGITKASSLSNDQLEVMDEVAESLDKLLKKRNIEKELSKGALYLLRRKRKAMAEARIKVDELRDAESKLSVVTKSLGDAWSESFGKLNSGSKDAEKVFSIFKNSFSRFRAAVKPELDKVKRQIAETLSQKIGISPDKGKMLDTFKKMTTKDKPDKLKGMTSLAAKKDAVSPGKSLGDMKRMTDAANKLSKSGTKAGSGMAKASKGMVGVSKVGAKAGAVATGVGKSMAKAGTKVAAKVGAMTAFKGAVGAVFPPLGALILILDAASMAMSFLTEGISLNVENMEKFRRTGYRASGSIRDLLDTSADLSISLGASSEEAYGTVQALTEAGFAVHSLSESLKSTDGTIIKGQKALLRLSQANLKFSDSTGAAAKVTAGFQKRLTVMKVPIEDQEAALGALSQASAKYMLTGTELNGMMQTLTKTSIQIEAVWADTNMYDYTMALGALAGAAKEAGIDMGITAQIMNDVSKASKKSLMIAQAGGGLGAFFGGDQTEALAATAKGADAVLKRIKGYTSAVTAARVAEVYGGVEYLTALSKAGKELEKQGALRAKMSGEQIAREKMMAESRKALDKGYDESTKTISKAFQRLSAPILMAAAKVAGPLVDAVAAMAAYVRPVMDEIGSAFNQLWTGIKDIFTPFMPALRVIGKLIWGLIVIGVMRITTTMKALGFALSVVGKILSVVFAPVNWGLEVIEMAIDGIIHGLFTMGKWIDSAANGFWKMLSPVVALIDKIATLAQTIMDFKKSMFGSSFLHIREGIGEILPSVDKLASGFDKTAKSALEAKKATVGSSFLHIGEGVDEVLPSMNKLQESFKFPERPVGKAEETKETKQQPMGVHTVKFRDGMSKDQVESQAGANASILEIHRLIREYVNKETPKSDEYKKQLEELKTKHPDKYQYGFEPVKRHGRPRPGENLKRTY